MRDTHASAQVLGRKWLVKAIDDSLARLKLDFVDIWYLHLDDYSTPLEEAVSAVADVLGQGKALYWGVSNFRGWRIAELVRLAGEAGIDRRSEEHTSELQSLMRNSYAVFCLKKKT